MYRSVRACGRAGGRARVCMQIYKHARAHTHMHTRSSAHTHTHTHTQHADTPLVLSAAHRGPYRFGGVIIASGRCGTALSILDKRRMALAWVCLLTWCGSVASQVLHSERYRASRLPRRCMSRKGCTRAECGFPHRTDTVATKRAAPRLSLAKKKSNQLSAKVRSRRRDSTRRVVRFLSVRFASCIPRRRRHAQCCSAKRHRRSHERT